MIMSRIWKHNSSEWFEIDPRYVFPKGMETCIFRSKKIKYLKYTKQKNYLIEAEKYHKRNLSHE